MVFQNYQGEQLVSKHTNEELIAQLQELESQGKTIIILPCATYFKVHGLEGVKALTHDEWLDKKREEWKDAATYDEEVAELSFKDWLEDDMDNFYVGTGYLIEYLKDQILI